MVDPGVPTGIWVGPLALRENPRIHARESAGVRKKSPSEWLRVLRVREPGCALGALAQLPACFLLSAEILSASTLVRASANPDLPLPGWLLQTLPKVACGRRFKTRCSLYCKVSPPSLFFPSGPASLTLARCENIKKRPSNGLTPPHTHTHHPGIPKLCLAASVQTLVSALRSSPPGKGLSYLKNTSPRG